MRHIVYLLVVANLVYFGWNSLQSQSVMQGDIDLLPLPESAARLVTLQERELAQTADAIETLTQNQPPQAGLAIICQALGPFMSTADVHAAQLQLADLGLEPEQRETAIEEPNGYWVYLPAMEYAEVQRVAQVMKEHDDDEYYVGKDNFISLGTFREIDRAEIRLEESREMGLKPILEARYKARAAYWLDVRLAGNLKQQLVGLVGDYPDAQLLDQACY